MRIVLLALSTVLLISTSMAINIGLFAIGWACLQVITCSYNRLPRIAVYSLCSYCGKWKEAEALLHSLLEIYRQHEWKDLEVTTWIKLVHVQEQLEQQPVMSAIHVFKYVKQNYHYCTKIKEALDAIYHRLFSVLLTEGILNGEVTVHHFNRHCSRGLEGIVAIFILISQQFGKKTKRKLRIDCFPFVFTL